MSKEAIHFRPCIGFTGSAGTGKTTTAKLVAEKLNIPYRREGVREWMEANNVTKLRELTVPDIMRLQTELLDSFEQTCIEATHAGQFFVSCRTPVDNLTYALIHLGQSAEVPENWFYDYYRRTTQIYFSYVAKTYMLPWGAIKLVDDNVRSSKKFYQLTTQLVMERLIIGVGAIVPFDMVPMKVTDLDERVALITNNIRQTILGANSNAADQNNAN